MRTTRSRLLVIGDKGQLLRLEWGSRRRAGDNPLCQSRLVKLMSSMPSSNPLVSEWRTVSEAEQTPVRYPPRKPISSLSGHACEMVALQSNSRTDR